VTCHWFSEGQIYVQTRFVVRERLLQRGPSGTDVGSHHRLRPTGILGLVKPIAAVVAVLGVSIRGSDG